MTEPTSSDNVSTATATGPDVKPVVIDLRRLRWRLLFDVMWRRVLLVVTAVVVAIATIDPGGSGLWSLAVLGLFVVWVVMAVEGAKVSRQLPELSVGLDHHTPEAGARLAALLHRRLLPRWVKLMLWHRVSVLRHRDGEYVASAQLAQTLLETPSPGSFRQSHTHLWLMLLEARLELRDAVGAWIALEALCRRPLSLTEALQRMALRTRYELLIGLDDAALTMAEQKLRLSELMPGPQCGAFHAMLATAAGRTGQQAWSEHVWGKVALLCTEEQVQRLRAASA